MTNNYKKKALFLDRDGVINKDIGYLCNIDQCEFMPGVFDFCSKAKNCGYQIFVITNQAGIARGYYTENQFHQFTNWMESVFKDNGVIITKTYYCPHHPEFGNQEYRRVCNCRKPEPGMLLQAITEYGIDPLQSIMIGDKETDMQAAQKAGIKTTILFDGFEKIYKTL